jgi:hypothetical protein
MTHIEDKVKRELLALVKKWREASDRRSAHAATAGMPAMFTEIEAANIYRTCAQQLEEMIEKC